MSATKQFNIPKGLVWQAYKLVKANRGSAGVDGESLEAFEQAGPIDPWYNLAAGAPASALTVSAV